MVHPHDLSELQLERYATRSLAQNADNGGRSVDIKTT